MMNEMVYAPIIIPTLCRSEHFIRCIESLKMNSWASKTEVYIALDYPGKDEHREGYRKICDYLKGEFSEFAGFNVLKRERNFGASKNYQDLREFILTKYDRYISTDDDIEFSPNFLEYMDKCLHYYEDDNDVIAVTGYSYPIEWNVEPNSTLLKLNCVCSTWGLGFWKNKMTYVQDQLRNDYFFKEGKNAIKTGKIDNLIDARKVDFAGALINDDENSYLRGLTDIALGTYLGIADKWVIVPVISKSRNHGFDGSGVCCQKIVVHDKSKKVTAHNYDYENQPIDQAKEFVFNPDNLFLWKENAKKLDEFDTRTRKEIVYANAKIQLYRMFGSGLRRISKIVRKFHMS